MEPVFSAQSQRQLKPNWKELQPLQRNVLNSRTHSNLRESFGGVTWRELGVVTGARKAVATGCCRLPLRIVV
eukprot:1359976-Amorphochlora_amoeboformis.AAC.1